MTTHNFQTNVYPFDSWVVLQFFTELSQFDKRIIAVIMFNSDVTHDWVVIQILINFVIL
jgi:hypothetical protein